MIAGCLAAASLSPVGALAQAGSERLADATLLGDLIDAVEAVRVAVAALPALPDK